MEHPTSEYAHDFKAAVVKALAKGESVYRLAKDLRIPKSTVYGWRNEAVRNGDLPSAGAMQTGDVEGKSSVHADTPAESKSSLHADSTPAQPDQPVKEPNMATPRKGTRRAYSPEFKEKIVKRILDGAAYRDISDELDIHISVLRGWVAAATGGSSSRAELATRALTKTPPTAVVAKPARNGKHPNPDFNAFSEGMMAGFAFRDIQQATNNVLKLVMDRTLTDQDVIDYAERVKEALTALEEK